ncbi:MAG: ketoacyl-ACP synthase III [Elusimicrobiota bacterium]|nr:ketoacyl-ACP synthase III [Elusimicrobiota bacterium]
MNKKTGVKILGTGSYFPKKILTNADLEKMVDTNDEWITTRTGMKERHIAAPEEVTSDLALGASLEALKAAKIDASQIDLILVSTITSDMFFPTTACYLQTKLGLKDIPAYDLLAACSGFIYGLANAKAYIESGMYKTILLVGADILSRITDWTDRNTCVLFGDGAGAIVLTASEEDDDIVSVSLGADGSYSPLLYMYGGGSVCPATAESVAAKHHTMTMHGKEVFRNAVPKMVLAAEQALEKSGKKLEDIKLFIPHQANMRIIEAVAKKLNIPMDSVFINIHKTGNISSATTITALDEAIKTGKIKKGELAVLVAFGGGFTWGGAVIRV